MAWIVGLTFAVGLVVLGVTAWQLWLQTHSRVTLSLADRVNLLRLDDGGGFIVWFEILNDGGRSVRTRSSSCASATS